MDLMADAEMDLQWEISRKTSSVHLAESLAMAVSVMELQPAIVRDLRPGRAVAMLMRAASLILQLYKDIVCSCVHEEHSDLIPSAIN